MSNNQHSWFHQPFLKIGAGIIITLFLIARIGYGQAQIEANKNIVLQGSIHIEPAKEIFGNEHGKIQPGTGVKVIVTVENKGQQASSAGELFVRYAFAHPLHEETGSVIFETEKKKLPIIEPGKKIDVVFDKNHQIPSLLDFVRYDWSIREYQAIAVINHEEYMIGTLAITFSAYYYPGIKKEFPTHISPDITQ